MTDDFGIIVQIDLDNTYKKINEQMKIVQDWFTKNHKLNISLNLSSDTIKGLEQIGKYAQSSINSVDALASSMSKLTTNKNAAGNITSIIEETKNGLLELDRVFKQFDKDGNITSLTTQNVKNYEKQNQAVDKLQASQLKLLDTLKKFEGISGLESKLDVAKNGVLGLNINSSATELQNVKNSINDISNSYKVLLQEQKAQQEMENALLETERNRRIELEKIEYAQAKAQNKALEDAYLLKLKQEQEMENALLATEQRRKQEKEAWNNAQAKAINKALEDNYKLEQSQGQKIGTSNLLQGSNVTKEQLSEALLLSGALGGLEVKTISLDNATGKWSVTVAENARELKTLKGNYDQVTGSIYKTGESLKTVNSLSSTGGVFNDFKTAMEKFPIWIAASSIVMGVIHSFSDAYKAVVEFDFGLAGMRQTLEETYASMGKVLDDKEMNRIGEGFTQIAERWGQSVNEILTAGKAWSRQYKDVDEVMNLVNNSVLLSVVDNVSLDNSVKSLEATMNQWGKTARNAAEANQFSLEIVDKWSALAHKQMATANDLADANARTGAVARQTGVDFDHMQGLIVASLRATGRSGSEVGNMWKSVLGSINSKKAVTELSALGVATKDLQGNLRPVQDILTDLMIKMAGTEKNTEEVTKAVAGGKFQWAKLGASLGDMQTYLTATAISINSNGKAAEYMQAQMDTVARKTGQFHQSLIALVNSAGNNGLTGVIKGLLDNLRYFVDGLNNGGIKTLAFAGATTIAISAISKITTVIKDAAEAQKVLNATQAIGLILSGNWAKIAIAGVALAAVGVTIALGKQADQTQELLDKQKNQAEQQKAMIGQYQDEIQYVNELEQTRNKLINTMKGLADTDQRKIELNKDLTATEEALKETVGASTAETIKNANFSHDSFQLVTKSLQAKQDAEKVAWQNSQQLVTNSTNHLKQNILIQMEQVDKAVQAYGILGKLQETGLAVEKNLAYARFKLNPTPDNAKAYDDIMQNISDFYSTQKSNRMGELINQLQKLGGTSSNVSVPDIPIDDNLSGFKNVPMDSIGGKSSSSSSSSILDPTDALIRQINLQSQLTSEKNKSIKSELDQASSQKDYATQLSKTNSLLSSQKTEIDQLNQANTQLKAKMDEIKHIGFGAIGWLDENGELTTTYYDQYNTASKTTQEAMAKEADQLQKLTKAMITNNSAIRTLKDSNNQLGQSLQTIAQDLAKQVLEAEKSIEEYHVKQQKDALQSQIDQAEKALKSFKDLHQAKIDGYQAEIDALDRQNALQTEQEERNKRLLEIQNAQNYLNNVLSERNTRVYVEGQGWIFQANPNDVKKAQDDLKKLKSDYTDWERQNTLNHQKQMLQDQIKYEQDQIKNQEDSFNTLKDNLTTQMNTIQDTFDKQWKNINDMSTKLLDQFGGNVDSAVGVLSDKLKGLNDQLATLMGVTLPDSLQGIGGASANGKTTVIVKKGSPDETILRKQYGDSINIQYGSGNEFVGKDRIETNKMYQSILGTPKNPVSTDQMWGYADGGVNSKTGFHMLHGTSSSAETIFNSTDSKKLWDFVHNLPNLSTNMMSNLIGNFKIPQFTPNLAGVGSSGETININGNMTIVTPNPDDFFSQLKQKARLK